MTNEEIRIKVAESLGYKELLMDSGKPMNPQRWESPHDEFCYVAECLPNYPVSLDAIVPVIRSLPPEEQWAIFETLLEVVPAEYPAACATAKEWCLAYLKTKGLTP